VTTAGDLYQAGAVLFFMLTGQAPYLRPRRQQVVEAHLNAPPPVPSALAPAARSLDRVVTRAMAKEPSDRYLDAAEFRTAVGEALSRAGTSRGVLSPGVTGQAGHSPTRVMPTPGRPELPGSARARLHGVPARSTADLDYLAPAAAVSAPSDVVLPPPSRNPAATIAIAAVVAVALLAVLSTFAAPSAARPSPTGLPSTPSPSASPTPSRSSAPAVVSVPTLHGTLAAAERALRASGLTLGQVVRSESSERAGSVLGQSPDPGRQVARGSAVNLEIASGANAVPPTAGLTAAAAVATLESAGFVAVTSRLADDWSAPVIGTEPAAGTVLRLGVTVTVILDGAPAPTPGPTPSPSGTATASTPP
jgi:serine/threonine-protein kinase